MKSNLVKKSQRIFLIFRAQLDFTAFGGEKFFISQVITVVIYDPKHLSIILPTSDAYNACTIFYLISFVFVLILSLFFYSMYFRKFHVHLSYARATSILEQEPLE